MPLVHTHTGAWHFTHLAFYRHTLAIFCRTSFDLFLIYAKNKNAKTEATRRLWQAAKVARFVAKNTGLKFGIGSIWVLTGPTMLKVALWLVAGAIPTFLRQFRGGKRGLHTLQKQPCRL